MCVFEKGREKEREILRQKERETHTTSERLDAVKVCVCVCDIGMVYDV